MSFILDAIARSEQERQQQAPPGPQALALAPPPPPRRRGAIPWVIGAALLLNAGLLALWMQTRAPAPAAEARRDSGQAALPAPARPPETATAAPAAQVPGVEASDRAPPPASPAAAAGRSAAIDAPGAAPAPGEPGASNEGATNDGAGIDRAAVDGTATAGAAADTSGWIRIGPQTLDRKSTTAQAGGGGVGAIRVSSLRELPDEVRRDLPTVVFSGHLYSSDATASVVFIDGGRPVSTGRRIAGDVYLHEITPSGVVVAFRGYLIDVGVLQNWTLN